VEAGAATRVTGNRAPVKGPVAGRLKPDGCCQGVGGAATSAGSATAGGACRRVLRTCCSPACRSRPAARDEPARGFGLTGRLGFGVFAPRRRILGMSLRESSWPPAGR
jgi:hypothetical protein